MGRRRGDGVSQANFCFPDHFRAFPSIRGHFRPFGVASCPVLLEVLMYTISASPQPSLSREKGRRRGGGVSRANFLFSDHFRAFPTIRGHFRPFGQYHCSCSLGGKFSLEDWSERIVILLLEISTDHPDPGAKSVDLVEPVGGRGRKTPAAFGRALCGRLYR